MFKFSINGWVRTVLANLIIVAILGLLMRYKIRFELPYFDQQHLQHAHSHFAFAGWITQTLLVLITFLIQPQLSLSQLRKYNLVLWLNLVCAYGMLISFFIQGYGPFSIAFSAASIITTILFSRLFFSNSVQLVQYAQAIKWIKGALVFAILSYAGTLVLSYMMISKNLLQNWYLASIYFYLHFQYNGWFFFASIGLFIGQANKHGISVKNDKLIFYLLFCSCIPAYFLSVLWAHIPAWLYVIVALAAVTQLTGWCFLLKNVFVYLKANFKATKISLFLIYFVVIAGSIKYLLQLGSTIPSVSHLAFGFRPIVIAYLHLVLLALTSMMLMLYMFQLKLISNTGWSTKSLICFAIGILLNELILAVQGVASLSYVVIPYTNNMLLIAAMVLFLSAFGLFLSQFNKLPEKE